MSVKKTFYSQVLGGYFSDKFGGQRVIFLAAIGWSLITFWMPNIIYLAPKAKTYAISFVVTIRIINGAFQGVHFPSMISVTSQVSNQSFSRVLQFSNPNHSLSSCRI